MKRKRFTEEEIIGILKEAEAGAKNQELCRKPGTRRQRHPKPTTPKSCGGMQVSEAKKLRGLDAENRKLKQLLAEAHLDNAALKELLSKNW